MANSSFFQNAVEKANKKPATAVERLAEAYNKNTQRESAAVETPVLDSAVKQNSKQAFSPASSLDEFMGILPTPEVKNDGLDGTHVAQIVRDEWTKYGVDNADDYRPQVEWAGRGLKSGAVGAARDSVNYLGNTVQQGNRAFSAQSYAESKALADLYNGTAGGKTYEELYEQYAKEYQDNTEQKPLQKTVDWGEDYDAETQRLAEELNVSDAAIEQYQFNQMVGRMAPAIAISATGNLAGGGLTLLGAADAAKTAFTIGRVLSSAATFTSAAGGAYEDAKAHGIDDDKAMTYATTVGAIELATESISSGLGKLGGKAIGTGGFTDDFVSSLAKKVSSDPNVQNAVIYAGGVLGEGFEEWLSEWGDYAANRLLVKYDDRTLKDVWGDSKESFMQGAMMSSLLNITQLMQRGVPPKEAIRQGVDETAAEAGISPTAEQQRSTEPSAQNGQTTKEAPTTFAVEEMLKNPVSRSQANRIINDANLRAEYEAYTGEKLPSVKSEAEKAVMEYSRNHAELTPMAQVVLNQRAETAPVPETQTGTVSPAAQTMASAATQNAVQESAPARTEISPATQPEVSTAAEVSPAARTMADVLTGKQAESTIGDNMPQQQQNANGTSTSPGTPTRLSQTVETVRDAAVTPDAVKQSINENIENGGYRYIPESNADAVASARASIKENGYDSVLRSWTSEVARGKTSNDLFATGAVLYNEAIQSGNTKLALDILTDYQMLGTNTAQGLQAMRIIKDLTPDGQLYIMQQDVKKLNDSRSETAKRKNPEGYKIDPELADAFIDAKDAAARDAAVTAIQQDIASQIPASPAEKWRALRYLNMLGNVKTQVRNLLGNTAMMGLTGAKNTMLTGIEYLANKLSGGKYERNTAFGVRDYMDAAKKYYKIVDDYVNGDAKFMESNMNASFSRGIQDARKIFGSKPLEAYRKATQWAMTQGDVLFIRPQFARSLSGYLKARGMDANTFTQIVNGDIQATAEQQNLIHNATEYAAREAQEATFHDNNEISKAVYKVGKGWPAPVRALFEGILPFRKTPANVLVRAEEYSPLGVVNTAVNAYQAAKGLNGKTAADVINSFSKTATGTSLFALGAMLAKAGLARGKEDDEDQAAFDKMQGKQDFSIVLPDGSSYTMDWLSPAAVPFFMGVAFSDAMSDGDITVGEFLKALDTLTDPMIEMSMLQGVNDALDQIRYADDSLVNFALNQMVNYVSQGIGNTLYGQIERITEKNRETTYTASDTSESRMAERTLGKVLNKLPGEYNQVEYVDAWGRTQSNGSVAERAFSNLLSPGYIGKNNSTEVDNELQRLYDAGQTNVFPSRIAMTQTVNVYRNDGRKIDARRLTKDEYVQYQKVMGQTSLELVKDLMKSPVYNGMSDEAKADAISEIYGYAKRMAAMAVEPSAKYGEKTDVSKLSNPAAYYAAKASFSAASKESEDRNYDELDSLTASFNRLPSDVRDAVTDGNSGLAKLLDARENGYTARQYYNVYDTVNALTPAEGYADVATWQKIDAVCSMNVSDKEKDYFVMNYFEGSTKDKYTAAREAGYSPYSVSVAYQTYQLSKGVDRNGDGRNDTGTKKAAFIEAMMEQGASRKSAEWLYDLFSPNK